MFQPLGIKASSFINALVKGKGRGVPIKLLFEVAGKLLTDTTHPSWASEVKTQDLLALM